jgi:hypothetical protein
MAVEWPRDPYEQNLVVTSFAVKEGIDKQAAANVLYARSRRDYVRADQLLAQAKEARRQELEARQKAQEVTQGAQEEGARPAEGIRARAEEGAVTVGAEAAMGKLVRKVDLPVLFASPASEVSSQPDDLTHIPLGANTPIVPANPKDSQAARSEVPLSPLRPVKRRERRSACQFRHLDPRWRLPARVMDCLSAHGGVLRSGRLGRLLNASSLDLGQALTRLKHRKCVELEEIRGRGRKSIRVTLLWIPRDLEHPGVTKERKRHIREVRKANPSRPRRTPWYTKNVERADDDGERLTQEIDYRT